KLVDSRWHEKALEAAHTRAGQGRKLFGVARHHAPPKGVIDRGMTRGRSRLQLQGGRGRGDGNAVQRHVDDGGDPTGSRGPRGRLEPLPFGPAGLVHVYVRVHDPGQEHRVSHVETSSSVLRRTVTVNG